MDSVVARFAEAVAMSICGSLTRLCSVLPNEPLCALLCIAIGGV